MKANTSQYTFIVDKAANKKDLKTECQDIFGVEVLSVNVANILGKEKMTKRIKGRRSDYKKAVIRINPKDKIDLFVTEEAEKSKTKKDTKVKKTTDNNKNSKDVEVTVKKK